MEKTCVIFVIKKLHLVNFRDLIWIWIFDFLNFPDYGWTWTEL